MTPGSSIYSSMLGEFHVPFLYDDETSYGNTHPRCSRGHLHHSTAEFEMELLHIPHYTS